MAEVGITGYNRIARDGEGNIIAAGEEPALYHTVVAIPGTSDPFPAGVRFILAEYDQECRSHIDKNPDATGKPKKAAGSAQFFGLREAGLRLDVKNP